MRVLMATRLFSGLIQSAVEQKWQPTGIPAMYRFIEGLSRQRIPADVVFLCKTAAESKDIHDMKVFTIDDDRVRKINFHVVPFYSLKIRSTKLNGIWNEWRQWRYCVRVLKASGADAVYCDRSHVIFGATARLWFKKRVTLRLLGFYPDMKKLFTTIRYKLWFPLTYLAYFAPFDQIICTQDDSGGSYYLSKLPRRSVPKALLVNGVAHKDSSPEERAALRIKHGLEKDWPILLYVGKIEKPKGCLEFIEVMDNLYKSGRKFYALMLGQGSLEHEVQAKIAEQGIAEVVKYVGAVDNDQIYHYYNLADVYVHLYLWASLTNTVLEAMRAGRALVILSSSAQTHAGKYADSFIPDDCKIEFDRDNMVQSLTSVLGGLLGNKGKMRLLQRNMEEFAKDHLSSWSGRVDEEIKMVVGGENNLPQSGGGLEGVGAKLKSLPSIAGSPHLRKSLRTIGIAAAKLVYHHGVRKNIGGLGEFIMNPEFTFCDYRDWGKGKNNGFNTLVRLAYGKKAVLDIGAHIGLCAMPIAQALGKGGVCYAFEPAAENASYLKWHIERNNLSNVKVIEKLVGEKTSDRVEFYEADQPDGMNARVRTVGDTANRYKRTAKAMISLDDFCKEYNVIPDLIKIDVEGGEIGVLKGAAATLKAYKPDIILSVHPKFLPLYGASVDDLLQIISAMKYKIFEIDTMIPASSLAMKEYRLVYKIS